jgi:hypothetical protein
MAELPQVEVEEDRSSMRASRMRVSKGEGEGVKERDHRTSPPCVRMVK